MIPKRSTRLPGAQSVRTLIPSIGSAHDAGRPVMDRGLLLDALVDILSHDRRPTLIVIEDLHWASPLTLQVLDRIVRTRPADSRITVLCTSRDEHGAHAIGDENLAPGFWVGPWTIDTVRAFVLRFSDRWAVE